MIRLFFSGIVRPERAVLNIGNIENELRAADGSKTLIKFNAYNNQITVSIESEKEDNFYTLRNIVRSVVEIVTNVVGFLKGYAYDVEIVKVFSEDLELSHVFGIDIPALEQRNKDRNIKELNHIYPLCLGNDGVFLRRALSDLGMAIKHADDTPFYCFRAIESLKQYFGFMTGTLRDADQWQEMTKAIGDHLAVIEPIRLLAFPARHGVPQQLTDEDRKTTFLTTWDIVEKFIDFRLTQTGSSYQMQSTANENI